VGTSFKPAAQRLPSRKLWIAFARASEGQIVSTAGRGGALVERGKSLISLFSFLYTIYISTYN